MDEITAAQAAILMGVSERTIRRKIASGVISARRLGRNRYAIKVSDLHVNHPVEALVVRVEALERRLDRLEAQFRVPVDSAQPGVQPDSSTAPSPIPAQFYSASVQHLFAQLAYETARLAKSISFPPDLPQATVSSPVDKEEASGHSGPSRSK
jgi:excisionase family DNA binding protein